MTEAAALPLAWDRQSEFMHLGAERLVSNIASARAFIFGPADHDIDEG